MSSLQVHSVRGGIVESIHRVSVAVVDTEGRLVAGVGNPEFPTHVRSAAKPFQALPLFEDGVAEHFALTDAEVALACASHNSERRQVERVASWLQRIGLTEADLACSPHEPLGKVLTLGPTHRSVDDGTDLVEPSPVASNCSGKHTGMLALALTHGYETSGYHRPDHQVQQRMLSVMARCAGIDEGNIGCGVDGCGVVAFAMPLSRMARAYAGLTRTDSGASWRVAQAMMTHPEMVAGEGRLDTALMRAFPGKIIAKVGAEGVFGVSLMDQKKGLALKVEDGNARAAVVALVAVLRRLGVIPDHHDNLAPYETLETTNTRGEKVGYLHAAGDLSGPGAQ